MLSVARLNPTKGHLFFLQALRRALDLGAHVTILGSVSEDQVLALLHDTDVFALTSTGQGEAGPVAVMEAMATGVAVICSIIGGTPDMISDGVDGLLVAQKDVDGLTAALASLAADPAYRQKLGQAARAKSLAVFDYRVTARQLLAMVEARG